MSLSQEHLEELAEAKTLLENPGFAIKVANYLGKPIEKGLGMLPEHWSEKLGFVTRKALNVAFRVALQTMDERSMGPSPGLHRVASAISGAVGGAFGLAALTLELPISTTIICRSIADIARANGELLRTPEARLACMEVFALSGPSSGDDGAETAYFATRIALARELTRAAEYLASRSGVEDGIPALVRFIGAIAMRYNIQVSQKLAAQAIPLIGAGAGAAINLMFMAHFQNMSRGHFTVRRLERIYGPSLVKAAYETTRSGSHRAGSGTCAF